MLYNMNLRQSLYLEVKHMHECLAYAPTQKISKTMELISRHKSVSKTIYKTSQQLQTEFKETNYFSHSKFTVVNSSEIPPLLTSNY